MVKYSKLPRLLSTSNSKVLHGMSKVKIRATLHNQIIVFLFLTIECPGIVILGLGFKKVSVINVI